MSKGKYQSRKRTRGSKSLIALLAVVLTLTCVVGGTLAWLTDKTDEVANTFTVGDINIGLDESDNLDLKMVPGKELTKDPKVTIEAGSEASWVFVKVEESSTLDTYIDYVVLTGKSDTTAPTQVDGTYWTELDVSDVDYEVYYCKVNAIPANGTDEVLPVIGYIDTTTDPDTVVENKVLVKESVTKTDMENLQKTGAVQPTLTFTAYAIQQLKFDTAAAAWAEVSKPATNS